jgi:flavin reductase (DIM6/NTAB) family NADH-FMN oxidoreductase RutF
MLMLSIGKERDGPIKDTRRNIVERNHFVVHLPHAEQIERVNESSRELPASDSEIIEAQQLPTTLLGTFTLPRLLDCRIALACTRYQITEIGPQGQALILDLIESIYIDDTIVRQSEKGVHIDASQLDPLSCLGGEEYWLLGLVKRLPRPRQVCEISHATCRYSLLPHGSGMWRISTVRDASTA